MTRSSNILAIALASMMLCSCSMLTGRTPVGSATAQALADHENYSQGYNGNIITHTAGNPAMGKIQDKGKPQPAAPSSGSTATAAKGGKGAPGAQAAAYNGEWLITEVNGHKVSDDTEMPYLIFDTSTGRFYGSNGCNIINGLFGVQGDVITFGNVITTMMLCPDAQYEQEISAVLCDGAEISARVTDSDDIATMVMMQRGRVVMQLRKHNLARLDGQWQVINLGNTKIADPELNIFIDSNEMKVHGNTGCNYFNGAIEMVPDRANSISFMDMAVTMRACPNADFESRMLVALEEAASYRMEKNNQLALYSADGNRLMTLVRIARAD